MIYKIDSSVMAGLDSAEHKSNILSTLENLGIHRSSGGNIVFALDEEIFDSINKEEISPRAKRAFVKAKSDMSFAASLFKEATIKAIVTFDVNLTEPTLDKENNTIILPAHLDNSHSFFSTPVLLAENINDGQFYVAVTKATQKHIPNLKNISLSYEIQNGGGSTTAATYNHIKANNRFCFCITDSDRLRPGGSIGDTASAIAHSDKESPHPKCSHMIIDVYSVENLFPLSLLAAIYKDSAEVLLKINTLKIIIGRDSWKHLPLKKGITGRYVSQNDTDSEYWKNEIIGIKGKIENCPTGKKCSKDNCNCYEVQPIPGKSLSMIIEQLKSAPDILDEFYGETSENVKSIWKEICMNISYWFCSGRSL